MSETEKPEKNKGGRPKIELTPKQWKVAEGMANIQCTRDEIAGVLGIDHDTFTRILKDEGYAGFSAWFKRFSAGGKVTLRRQQFKLAEKNASMSIWLGKQYLEQKDQQDISGDITVTKAFDTSKMSKEEYKEFVKAQLGNKNKE